MSLIEISLFDASKVTINYKSGVLYHKFRSSFFVKKSNFSITVGR